MILTSRGDTTVESLQLVGFVSIQSRIVAVRPLERPEPLPLGNYTGECTIGRQRGLQRALGASVPICVGVRIRARARDSTCMGEMQE